MRSSSFSSVHSVSPLPFLIFLLSFFDLFVRLSLLSVSFCFFDPLFWFCLFCLSSTCTLCLSPFFDLCFFFFSPFFSPFFFPFVSALSEPNRDEERGGGFRSERAKKKILKQNKKIPEQQQTVENKELEREWGKLKTAKKQRKSRNCLFFDFDPPSPSFSSPALSLEKGGRRNFCFPWFLLFLLFLLLLLVRR